MLAEGLIREALTIRSRRVARLGDRHGLILGPANPGRNRAKLPRRESPVDEAYTVAGAGSPSVIGDGLNPLTMR